MIIRPLLLAGLFHLASPATAQDSLKYKPDTVSFASGNLQLKGFFYKPEGKGPFPAILFNHGSEPRGYKYVARVANYFASQGYAFFVPFRRGQYLSDGQGTYILDRLKALRDNGYADSAARLALELHETEQFQDQLAGLTAMKKMKHIDTSRIAVIGISFGGIQTMVMATKPHGIKAAVNFAGAAMMWNQSPAVANFMKRLATEAQIPVYFVQAENDYSVEPSIQGAAAMQQAGKDHRLKIYPPRGTTKDEGHTLVASPEIWESEVMAFLKKYLQ